MLVGPLQKKDQFLRNYLAIPAIHFFGFPGQLVVPMRVWKPPLPQNFHLDKFWLWFLALLLVVSEYINISIYLYIIYLRGSKEQGYRRSRNIGGSFGPLVMNRVWYDNTQRYDVKKTFLYPFFLDICTASWCSRCSRIYAEQGALLGDQTWLEIFRVTDVLQRAGKS